MSALVIKPKSVAALARTAGLPEDMAERHLDSLVNFAFVVADRERKRCRKEIRAWIHDGSVIKTPLEDVLRREYVQEPYDLI